MKAREVMRAVSVMLRPYVAKMGAMVAPAVVKAVNDNTKIQTLKVKWFGDLTEPVPNIQPGGLSHSPVADAEGVLLSTIQGLRFFVGGAARDKRPTGMTPGETTLWAVTTDGNVFAVHLDSDGNIVIEPDPGDGLVFIGAYGSTNRLVLGDELVVALSKIKAWMDALDGVINSAMPIVEPGNGSPSALQAALALALAGDPMASPPEPIEPPSQDEVTGVKSQHRIDG